MSQVQDVPSEQSLENETGLHVRDKIRLYRREIACKLNPILKLMKLTGELYGDASFVDEISESDSYNVSRFYCVIVMLGQWFIVVQSVTSVFFEGFAEMGTFYFLMIFSIWSLQSAAVTTICLFVLPKRQTKTSRFSQFLRSLCTRARDENETKKYRVNVILAFVSCFAIFNSLSIILLDLFRNGSVTTLRPWNGLLAFRLILSVFGFYSSFSWALPFSLFFVSCDLLLGIFANLEKKISAGNPDVSNIACI